MCVQARTRQCIIFIDSCGLDVSIIYLLETKKTRLENHELYSILFTLTFSWCFQLILFQLPTRVLQQLYSLLQMSSLHCLTMINPLWEKSATAWSGLFRNCTNYASFNPGRLIVIASNATFCTVWPCLQFQLIYSHFTFNSDFLIITNQNTEEGL